MADSPLFRKNLKVIIVKRFTFESNAQIYKAKLAEKGIKSFISNANTSTMIPFVEGGFTLHIGENDKEEALEIIRELDKNQDSPTDQDFSDADLEDIKYEKEVFEYEEKMRLSSWWDLVIYAVLIMVIFFIIWHGIK